MSASQQTRNRYQHSRLRYGPSTNQQRTEQHRCTSPTEPVVVLHNMRYHDALLSMILVSAACLSVRGDLLNIPRLNTKRQSSRHLAQQAPPPSSSSSSSPPSPSSSSPSSSPTPQSATASPPVTPPTGDEKNLPGKKQWWRRLLSWRPPFPFRLKPWLTTHPMNNKLQHYMYWITTVDSIIAVVRNDYDSRTVIMPWPRVGSDKGNSVALMYSRLFYFARLRPRLLFSIGAGIRALQQGTALQRVSFVLFAVQL